MDIQHKFEAELETRMAKLGCEVVYNRNVRTDASGMAYIQRPRRFGTIMRIGFTFGPTSASFSFSRPIDVIGVLRESITITYHDQQELLDLILDQVVSMVRATMAPPSQSREGEGIVNDDDRENTSADQRTAVNP